ncbi:hypothetical protein [Rhodoferax sp.]|uniref:hypothetical protein n=1 Tax=Rhodoferax sp. TaxID=50421 RepID=UPI00276A229E|nr:hypothetical protein [Rhodoferax sp.]
MKNTLLAAGVVVVLAASNVACDKLQPPQPQLQPPPPAAAGAVGQPDGERNTYSAAAQQDLDEQRTALAQLRIKAEAANEQVKARLRAELDALDAELGDAQKRLIELKAATAQSWQQLKEAFGKSRDKFKSGIEKYRKDAG